MKLSKNVLEIIKFASKSDIKPEIAGVYLKDNKIVATDSFRLVEITEKNRPEDDFIKDGVILPIRKIKIDKENDLILSEENKIATIISKDNTQLVKATSGTYPEYEKVTPNAETKILAEITMNGELLGEVLEYMGKFAGYNGVKLTIYEGEHKPIKLEVDNRDYKIMGLVMPTIR